MSEAKRRALVVDDDDGIRWVLQRALERAGIDVVAASSAGAARQALSRGQFSLVFLDVRLPDGDGLELLADVSETQDAARSVVITAQDAMSAALEAMKRGAYDFLAKPFDVSQVGALVEEVFRGLSGADHAGGELRPSPAAGLVGQSQRMLEVVKSIGRVAPTGATVLITGESGTGKELVARAIHTHSARAAAPFVTVNTAAIPRELLESELYGHERGAFTGATERRVGKFEQATGGTLLLDEIGDMPLDQQAKLLRVLQESRIERVGGSGSLEIDVRVIAASNVELARAVEQKLFREDLYYRLNVLPLALPPLRERRDDISLLVRHFLDKHQAEASGRKVHFTDAALGVLSSYAWPGNVRELENAVRRVVVLARADEIGEEQVRDLVPALAQTSARASGSLDEMLADAIGAWVASEEAAGDLYEKLMQRWERPLLSLVMERTRGNQLRAAEILGINRNTLRKKLQALGLRDTE